MWHAIPIEHLLFLLCSDAVVLVQEVEEWALWFFERSVGAGLQIAQVGEDAFLKFLGILHRAAKGLEAERETPYYICAGDVEQIVPLEHQSVSSGPFHTVTCRAIDGA